MPSFDAVIESDLVELRNAVEQANKEITTRFDFKGSSAQVDLAAATPKQRELTLWADSDFQLDQVRDVLLARLAKRGVPTIRGDTQIVAKQRHRKRPIAPACDVGGDHALP